MKWTKRKILQQTPKQIVLAEGYRVISFRAECMHDVAALQQAVAIKGFPFYLSAIHPQAGYPDVHAEAFTTLSMEVLDGLLSEIEDSHVIRETLRECPAHQNSFVRHHD